jgi:dTMP kinase
VNGRYFVLDGPDGCGKSTQAKRLCTFLAGAGVRVQHLREPGSTPVGEALRALLLSPSTGQLSALTEALLFTAARAELVRLVIAPALAQGTWIVAERSFLSTLAYQCLAPAHDGVARSASIDQDFVLDLTRRAHGPTLPDALFVLDVPPAVAAERRRSRAADRFERRGETFAAAVRAAYLEIARRDPTVQVVDAARAVEVVQQDLQARMRRWL